MVLKYDGAYLSFNEKLAIAENVGDDRFGVASCFGLAGRGFCGGAKLSLSRSGWKGFAELSFVDGEWRGIGGLCAIGSARSELYRGLHW